MNKLRRLDIHRRDAEYAEFGGFFKQILLFTLRPLRLSGGFFSGLAALWVVLMLTGCVAVGPDYKAPDIAAPAEWRPTPRGGLSFAEPRAETLARWWTTLDDHDLSVLIERAAAGNLNLKIARARIRAARARRGIAEAGLFPSLGFGGSATVGRSSEDSGSGMRRELYRSGFDAGWEVDVFGGVRRSIEAAEGELETSAADYQDVLVSLLAEVALNYLDARTFQGVLQVAEENLKTQEETLQLSEWRFAAGLVSSLDVQQAKATLENTRAQLPRVRSNIEAAKNRLAILLGAFPGALEAQLGASKPIPEAPLEVAVGVPAETLRRRPDVRRAERQLAAQTARVGVATADLYPKFSLPGSIGLEALAGHRLFSLANRAWSLVGNFSWTIFKGGAIRQNIELQSALQEQALNQYEAAILIALEEVENSLIAFVEEQERRDTLTAATHAAQLAAELARDQYGSGLIDFQTVLDSQRSVLSFQEQLEQSKGQVTANLIGLYKALGGGWTRMAPVQP
jgi:NodT family efflux transporter outer membrane factor (OMF) lipoprotein